MRRLLVFALVLAAVLPLALSGPASAASRKSWAQAQINDVVKVGVLGSKASTFRPEYKLTQGQLASALTRSWHLQNPAPTNLAPPEIDGEVAEGTQMFASPGQWSVNPVVVTYQWQISTDGGGSWKAIKGATANSFWIPYGIYVGDELRVEASARSVGGSAVADSAPTAPVLQADPAAPVNAQPPTPPQPPVPALAKAPQFSTSSPAAPVSIKQLDAALVSYLGLSDAAGDFSKTLAADGLTPPAGTGTEIVARLLGLRINHPDSEDNLEIDPWQPATRAEAAYSFAQLLSLNSGSSDWVRSLADSFALPTLSSWQRRILKTAVSLIGYPYVWGGESETGQVNASGVTSPGGFDCSGFVWRVYKLQSYSGERNLAGVLRGRTTYQMSGEVGRDQRIYKVENLKPGDVLFFGHGPHSKPSEVDHTGVYIGGGFLVHSSDEGVTIVPFAGWLRDSFAWARRPLREAGLDR